MARKVYVESNGTWTEKVTPISLTWDGTVFEIDKCWTAAGPLR